MRTTYNNLHLFIRDSDLPPIGCGYYYIVTNGAMSHTAFRTKAALKKWLKETGLKIGKRSRNRGVWLNGSYTVNSEMLNNDEFFAKHAGKKSFYVLCNGSYSIGFIEETETGNILHEQNPNTDRVILDYKRVNTHLETNRPVRNIY